MAEQDIGLKIVDADGDIRTVAVEDLGAYHRGPIIQDVSALKRLILCDAGDDCAIAGTRVVWRHGDRNRYGYFMTIGGLKALKEYGNDLIGPLPGGDYPGIYHNLGAKVWIETCANQPPDYDPPSMKLEFYYDTYNLQADDIVHLYRAEHFDGPWTLIGTYIYDGSTIVGWPGYPNSYVPPIRGKRYYFKARYMRAGIFSYFSHYTVGCLPNLEETAVPLLDNIECYSAPGINCMHLWWNADAINWGPIATIIGDIPNAMDPFPGQISARFEIQYTWLDPGGDFDMDTIAREYPGDPVNPLNAFYDIVFDNIKWYHSYYLFAPSLEHGMHWPGSDVVKMWYRIRARGIREWGDGHIFDGAWSDPVPAWIDGYADSKVGLAYTLEITNFAATQGTEIGKIVLSWDAIGVDEWPPEAIANTYIIYYYDVVAAEYTQYTEVDSSVSTIDVIGSGAEEHITFLMQTHSIDAEAAEIYGVLSAVVEGWEA